jgi:hypothetical protein
VRGDSNLLWPGRRRRHRRYVIRYARIGAGRLGRSICDPQLIDAARRAANRHFTSAVASAFGLRTPRVRRGALLSSGAVLAAPRLLVHVQCSLSLWFQPGW